MKPVDQIVFEDGKGDCLRACVAAILELPVEEVPNFAEDGSYINGAIQYLGSRGFVTLRVDFTGEGYDSHQYFSCPSHYAVVCGKSPRSTPEKRKGHAVVGRAWGWSFKVDHDPHPSRAGLAGEPESVLWIFRPIAA